MNSETVDLIYLDPPFNSKKNWKGDENSESAGQMFFDTWRIEDTEIDSERILEIKHPKVYSIVATAKTVHSPSMYSYLIFMGMRIIEMYRILKGNGTLYLHCDDTSNTYLRLLLDAIFGHQNGPGVDNRGSEITWQRTSTKNNADTNFGRICDTIFKYTKGTDKTHNAPRVDLDENRVKQYKNPDNDPRGPWVADDYSSPQQNESYKYDVELDGVTYEPPAKGWRAPKAKMLQNIRENLMVSPKKSGGRLRKKKFLRDNAGKLLGNLWTDIPCIQKQSKENTGWATQKPVALLNRIIRTSANEGDIVFDPFCGCGTTIIAAVKMQTHLEKHSNEKQYNVKYIGCDTDHRLKSIMENRFRKELPLLKLGEMVKISKIIPKCRDIESHEKLPDNKEVRDILFKRAVEQQIERNVFGKHSKLQCPACEKHLTKEYFEVDHIVAKANGGTNTWDNVHLLCGPCNRTKGTKSWTEFIRGRNKITSHREVFSLLLPLES